MTIKEFVAPILLGFTNPVADVATGYTVAIDPLTDILDAAVAYRNANSFSPNVGAILPENWRRATPASFTAEAGWRFDFVCNYYFTTTAQVDDFIRSITANDGRYDLDQFDVIEAALIRANTGTTPLFPEV